VTTKHEQILTHIEALPVGEKISVRGIARDLQVSEGTAYRAMKDAETQGFVSSMDRIGTVRIEQKQKKSIERLSFAEVVNIVEGTVLGGRAGLHKSLGKFVIGAMKLESFVKYIDAPGCLVIVGDRDEIQRKSLTQGAAVLITGGFDAVQDIQKLADELELPLISCAYDTFTTATLINRAIYDRLIKKDILFVEDLVVNQELAVIGRQAKVRDYYDAVELTGHTRVPVVDEQFRVLGMVTPGDVAEAKPQDDVVDLMVRHPASLSLKTTVASAAHRMIWEGIELMPVVDHKKLVGVLSRQDVIKALQLMSRQPQMAETLQDSVLQRFTESVNEDKSVSLFGEVTPQMTSAIGTLSTGVLTSLIEATAILSLQRNRNVDMVVDNLTLYFLKPISVDSRIEVRARVLDFGRRYAKVEVEIYDGLERTGKAMLTTQMLER